MKKFIKFIIGLVFLPLCWAFSRTLFFLLQSPAMGNGMSGLALPIGFLVSVAGFFLLPRPFRTYVLAHEMSHALWGMLMGAKVGKMKVGKNGGHVMLSKSNFLISLAPYFFPLYTGLAIALWYGLGFFYDLSRWEVWWLAGVGLTWGFHVTFTVYMLTQNQPDVLENGRLFSYVIIYLANLLLVALWIILVGSPTFRETVVRSWGDIVAAYDWVWSMCVAGWQAVQPLFGQKN